VEAILAVRPIHEIRLYSRSSAAPFAQEVEAKTDITVIVAQTAHEALSSADVVVTATNSSVPIIYAADLAPGAHINGIGSFTPVMREVASDVVVRSKIVVDHRESAWAEAGDLIIPRDEGLITEDDVYAEIGEIATGKLPGRTSADEITFFKSVGNAVQDAAVAGRILQVAQERQMGTLASL
jgi:ornithine cyclodeaminase/alanine dehydrogenase-like protein (mu-crystallin family)